MSRLTVSSIVALSALSLLASCATPNRDIGTPPRETLEARAPTRMMAPPEYTISKQIRYSYTLRNDTPWLMPKARFWTYAPVPHTSHQWVEKVSSSQPYRSSRDTLGNEILSFEVENLPPYGAKIVSITVDLKMTEQAAATGALDLARFSRPEPYIESDDRRVVELAATLRQPVPAGSVRALYEWVTANVKTDAYISEDRGALYAFTARKGDCTEFSYLLAALGRASGVPTRPIGGYVFKGNAIVKPVDYHNWVEFFVDDRWQVADAQKKMFMQNQSDYVAMRIIAFGAGGPLADAHRYSYAGEGLDVQMN